MLFTSVLYCLFLAVAVFGSWLLIRQQSLRFAFLLVASCVFYASACFGLGIHPAFLLLILGSTCWDFSIARLLEATDVSQIWRRRALLIGSVGMNLALLCYFKYLNFFLDNVGAVLHLLHWDVALPTIRTVLPIGISFYTFQTMSYCIDVYRKEIPAEKSLLRFALFSTFFPQLVAGPIVRAHKFLPQLHKTPSLSVDDVSEGLFRIGRGLAKKILIADFLAVNLVDRVFSQPRLYSSAEILVGLYAYTLQIYCDFSGYTDVAIGSARLLGYQLPENFMRPYRARTVAEFWRRWHMTLSTWLRHYVFFPLGGSRGSPWLAHRNTLITLTLIGLWHGANWTFVLYGLIHGIAIAVNRTASRTRPKGWNHDSEPWWQQTWKIALTFHFVVLLRILFRAPGLVAAGEVTRALAGADWSLGRIGYKVWLVLLLGYAIHWSPPRWLDEVRMRFVSWPAPAQGAALAGLAACMAAVAETDAVPFIYFQF